MATSLQLALNQENTLWRRVREEHREDDLPQSDSWCTSSPTEEARTLFRLLRKCDTVSDVRRLIMVSPAEEAELRMWAASSSLALAVKIEKMLDYRKQVLAAFDGLVAQQRQ